MRSQFILGALLFCLAPLPVAFAAEPPARAKDAVGVWKVVVGDPEKDKFWAIQVLDLKKDQTLTLTLTTPVLNEKGKTNVKRSFGKWTIAGDKVTWTLEKDEAGKEIKGEDHTPPPLTLSADGKSLNMAGESSAWKRQ